MDRMLVVVFDTEPKAYEGRRALNELNDEGSISVYADAVIGKNADGSATVKQTNENALFGTLVGTSLGSLIGLLGGPVGLAIGASVGLLGGGIADLDNARIDADFIDDVSEQLVPGKFAVAAEIQEEWTTPVDLRMEAIGGKVFRRALSVVRHTMNDAQNEAMKADLAQLKAEHANARADRKAKLLEKINQLDSKLQTRLEKNKQQRQAAEREAKAKAELLKSKAEALKTKAAEVHV